MKKAFIDLQEREARISELQARVDENLLDEVNFWVVTERLRVSEKKKEKALENEGRMQQRIDELSATIAEYERSLAAERSSGAERLSLMERSKQQVIDELTKENERLREERRWFAAHSSGHAFEALRQSHEYLQSVAVVQNAAITYGRHEGVVIGYHNARMGVPIETSEGYDPEAERRLDVAADDLGQVQYPYLQRIAERGDISIDDFKALKPAPTPDT